MKLVTESSLFDELANQVGRAQRSGRRLMVIELTPLEFKELSIDGHIQISVDNRRRESYSIYFPEIQQEIPVRITEK